MFTLFPQYPSRALGQSAFSSAFRADAVLVQCLRTAAAYLLHNMFIQNLFFLYCFMLICT